MSKASRRRAQATDLGKLMRDASHTANLWDVFGDFCEMAALSVSNAVDLTQYEAREARYMQIIGKYEPREQALFPLMLASLVEELEAETCDVLGRLFGTLELGNDARGQFFTPYEVCRMMAGIQIDDRIGETIGQNGFVTLMEPAVGAGAMVIAFAEEMRRAGFNPQQHLHVTAQDVDSRAVHMAYLQFSLLHIPAVIILGNTLALECREVWRTPAHVMGFWESKIHRASNPMLDRAPAEPPAASNDNVKPITPETIAQQFALF